MLLSDVKLLTDDTTPENRKYAEAFQAHDAFLVGVAFRFAPRPDMVPDIVQQAFVRFMERAVQKPWDLETEIKPLLYSITKSVALNVWRRFRQENPEVLTRIGEHLRRIQAENEHNEAVNERNTRRIEALKACRQALPPHFATLLEEHYDQEIPISEMAARRRVDAARVRKAISRLRGKLKDCIQKKLHERND